MAKPRWKRCRGRPRDRRPALGRGAGRLLAGLLLAGLAGCSFVRLAYDNLDWLVMREVNRYLSLEGAQEERFRERLAASLAEHRRERLEDVLNALAATERYAGDGFTAAEVDALAARVLALYEDAARRAIALLAPVLPTLTPAQVAHLKEAAAESNERFAERLGLHATPEERVALRSERAAERLAFWVGELSEAQHALIEDLARSLPDFVERWHLFRVGRQWELYTLIEGDAPPAALRRLLEQWWIEQDALADASYLTSERSQARLRDALLAIDRTLSERQRRHLVERLRGLREDLAAALPRSS